MKYTTTLLLLLLTTISFSQDFTIDQSVQPEEMITDFFQNDSVTISNISIVTSYTNMAFFDRGETDFPLGAGIVIATGHADLIPNPPENFASSNILSSTSDLDIEMATGGPSYDAAIIEFDFVPTNNQLLDFKYVFGSEEYPEWVGSSFNDAFLFLVSGPGIDGMYSNQSENTAMIPGTNLPVSINNVNFDSYSPFYIDNEGGTYLVYDAYTTMLPAGFMVSGGSTYHAKIVVSDVGDSIFDSAIFLGYNSLGNPDSLVPPTDFEIVAFQNEVIIENTSKYATDFEWDFGNGMFSFDKNPQNITYNAPGTYIVSLTASNYCCSNTFTTEIEIADLSLGIQTNVIKNASCNGFANGEIDINIAGGTGDYDIEITPSISSYSQIPAGEYTISLSDGETELTDSFVITEPDVLTTEESSEDSDINMNNGSATITIEGGTEPYSILWSTDETTATIENLEPGIYYFDVDDANGCTTSGSVEVSTIYAAMESSVTIVNNVSCFNGEDGVATLSVIGGNAPYEITISPEISDLNSLKAGEYNVTIVDQDDQTITNSFIITQPDALLLVDDVQASIEGEDNGMITIELSGGTEPYTILWSNGEETETIANLSPATYTVEVKDANDCIITGSYEVGSIVSVFDEELADFGLNPNPTSGFMIVTKIPKDINRAVVIDMIGREINLDVQKILEQDQVNVSHLANGVYILKLVDEQGTIYSSKFIKE